MFPWTLCRVIASLVALTVAGGAFGAEPAKAEDSTKLKTYSVGGTKGNAKPDTAVTTIERPKVDTDIGMERPVMDMSPFVVTPVTSAPLTATPVIASAKPVATKPPAAARPVAITAPSAAGATPTLPVPAAPVRSAPSPAGALPQVQGAPAPALVLVPLATPSPDYPREAMLAGTEGYVVVEFILNAEGSTQDISVIEASPPRVFDQSARRAVSRWKFQPVLVNGIAVEKRVQRRIDFKL